MSKTDQLVTKVTPHAMALPDYLREEQIVGMDALKDYIVPPVLKVVQKMSDALLEGGQFKAGDVVMLPARALVADYRTGPDAERFKVVPLFFYTEAITWTPRSMRDQGVPAVLERTTDKSSVLYRKATGGDKLWNEKLKWQGRDMDVRHVEHLNFIVTLYEHPLAGQPMILSFSKSEHRTGKLFASLIKARQASPFACVFEAHTCHPLRKNGKGSWHGLDIENPRDAKPWVTAEEHELFKSMHTELAESHRKGMIRAQVDEEVDTADAEEELEAAGVAKDF